MNLNIVIVHDMMVNVEISIIIYKSILLKSC